MRRTTAACYSLPLAGAVWFPPSTANRITSGANRWTLTLTRPLLVRDNIMTVRGIYTKRNKRLRKFRIAESYQDYLKSDLWQDVRARVLRRDNGVCRICGGTATQVHHTCYSAAALEGRSLVGLFAICRPCHAFVEFRQDGSKAHLFKDVRKRVRLLASLKGRKFIDPGQERRHCKRCNRLVGLQSMDEYNVCRRCRKIP